MTLQPIQLTPFGSEVAAEADACGCGGGSCAVVPAAAGAEAEPQSSTRQLLVTGMTCDHCVRAVSDELGALEGVTGVDVELVAGGTSRVTVRATADLDDSAVRGAVEEAGYSLV